MVYTLVCDRNERPELAGDSPPDGLLTLEETAVFNNLKTEKRQRDWLLGRYTAKHLVQHTFREEAGLNLSCTDYAIQRKENGAPYVSWIGANGRPPVTLSISHAGGLAFCALLLQADAYLGCDVEQVTPRSPTFIADYFTSEEQRLVAQTPAVSQPVIVNAIWSAKESALKALELGLKVDTRAVTCLPEFGRNQDWQPVPITLDADRLPGPLPKLAGLWRKQGPYVFTLAATSEIESVNSYDFLPN